jgi:hypothetical protein
VDAEFSSRLHELTAGNPFFIIQLLALVRSHGTSGISKLPRELPTTVRMAVVRQLDALPTETRRLLAIAAVLGRSFDIDLLKRTSEICETGLLGQLAPAVAAGILSVPSPKEGLYWFRHILVRDALYEEWPEDERARWHLLAAEALQTRHGGAPGSRAAEIAGHFLEAAPIGGVDGAIRYTMAAGRWAREQLAFEEAVLQLERALELGDRRGVLTGAETCDLLIELGAAHNACGSRSVARRALEEAAATARRLRDGRRLARAALGASPGFFAIETGVEDRSLIAMLEAALAACPEAEFGLRIQLLCRLTMAVCWSGEASRRLDLADRARELARHADDPKAMAYAAITRFAANWSPDNLDERAARSDRIVNDAEASGDLELELIARVFRISTLLELGDVPSYARDVRSLQRIMETGRYPQASWYPMMYEAALALLAGNLDDFDERVRAFARVGERFGDVNAAASMSVHSTLFELLKDRPHRALDIVKTAAAASHAVPAHHASVALCAVRAGQREEARSKVRQLCSAGFGGIPRDLFWLFAVSVLAEAIGSIGEHGFAKSCYELLRPYRGRHCTIGYGIALWSPVDRALGLLAKSLGEWEQSESHLCDAISMCDSIGARTLAVGTRLDLVELLEARGGAGDVDWKHQLIEGSLREAREMGLSYYVRRLGQIESR